MTKTLVIVESPAKAKTIGRYLGDSYLLAASVGHVRDLPSSSLGVQVNQGFKPLYITMRGKDSVIRDLKKKAESVDRVLLATDPDREGEAIAWHLATVLKLDPESPCRITFNEITQKAVQEAVSHPRSINLSLVHAQQARRILDRLVGYELSPLLWKKIKKGLSAGRVQSVATRMIVEREEEIEHFEPEEYWAVEAVLETEAKQPYTVKYYGQADAQPQKRILHTEEEATALHVLAQQEPFRVQRVTQKERKRNPQAPFTTSTLQQDAARRLGFSSKRTMTVAQQLYEGVELPQQGATALVTYIRTDSVRSSAEAVEEIRGLILKRYGPEYLPKTPRKYKNKNSAQDAHEAIRPAHFDLPPEAIRDSVSTDQFRLYRLIWERFLASQLESAVMAGTTVEVQNGTALYRASGEVVRFPGFLAAYGDDNATGEDKLLPPMNEKEEQRLLQWNQEQKFTQPPARYNEASLIKAMEEAGIGRPSTYAPTLSTILDRQYAEKVQRALVPTQLGRLVTQMLREYFDAFINQGFTAEMENELDQVEAQALDWVSLLEHFYPPFHEKIEEAATQIEKVEMPVVHTGELCPQCQHELVIKEGRYGKFISCSNFPACTFTKNLEEEAGAHCPECGGTLLVRKSKRGSKFYVCKKDGSNPECSFMSWNLPIDGSACPSCGAYLAWASYRGKLYQVCSNPDCPAAKEKKAARKSRTTSKGKSSAQQAEGQPSSATPSPKRGKTKQNETREDAQ